MIFILDEYKYKYKGNKERHFKNIIGETRYPQTEEYS